MVACGYVDQSPLKAHPSDVSDEEWAFVAPYLTLLACDAVQRKHNLCAVFNAVRYLAHTDVLWRYLPGDFPPWPAVYRQALRWVEAGCFEAIVHDLRLLLRLLHRRQPQPSGAILDARVLQSCPQSGARAGNSGQNPRKGSKVRAMRMRSWSGAS
ncbi:MAG: transposase [Ktedonobacterales bacterium]